MKHIVIQSRPIGLPAAAAAAALGIGETKFRELVSAGRLPPPVNLTDRLPRWSFTALEAAFLALGDEGAAWDGELSA